MKRRERKKGRGEDKGKERPGLYSWKIQNSEDFQKFSRI